MYVLFTPELNNFIESVSEINGEPEFNWTYLFANASQVEDLEDAAYIAHEVQRRRYDDKVFHFGVQVLKILPDGRADFKNPAFSLPQWRHTPEWTDKPH